MQNRKVSGGEGREFEAQLRARQRDTVWPDTLRGGYDVDKFIFRGSSTATPLQRIGIAIFALIFLGPAFVIAYFALSEPLPILERVVLLLLAVPFCLLSLKLLANAFRRR